MHGSTTTVVAASLALALGACGGSGGSDDPGGPSDPDGAANAATSDGVPRTARSQVADIRHVLELSVGTGTDPVSHDAEANLYALARPFSEAELARDYSLDSPQCLFQDFGDYPDDDPNHAMPGYAQFDRDLPWYDDAERVSGGEVLVLSAPGGTLGELVEDSGYYEWETIDPSPLPAGITLDVPGGAFPALANVRVPDHAPLSAVRVEQVSDDIDPGSVRGDSRLRWTPGGTGSLVHVWIGSGDGTRGIHCFAPDDGTLTLPEPMRSRMDADFGGRLLGAYRIDFDRYRDGEVYVESSRISGFESFGDGD